MDLKESELLGNKAEQHWYYASKSLALLHLLNNRDFTSVLDVGAGSGFFSRQLLKHTEVSRACCVDPNYSGDRDEAFNEKTLAFRRDTGRVDADLVLLMDVLEHVDDDVSLLREYVGKARADATFLISVPAFNFMWSAHDEFLGHRRRYTARILEETVRSAGLEPQLVVYYFAAVFPIALVTRILARRRRADQTPTSQLRRHGRVVNLILELLCAIELPLLRWNRIGGLTVFCLARTHASTNALGPNGAGA